MGEQKEGGGKAEPEKEKKAEAAAGGGGDKKKEEGVVEVKVDMHCVGCARKIRKAVKGLDGVERVRVDQTNNKMKVMGSIDPWKLKEFLEAYTKRKVEFISPKDPPKKKAADDPKKPAADNKEEKKSDDKPKPPPVSTVVLTMQLHCEGVEEVTVDAGNNLVTVKGTMDVKSLTAYLNDKFRHVKVVQPKKEDVPKKEEGKGGDGSAGGGGGEKDEKGGEKKEEKAGVKEEKGGEKGEEKGGEKKKDDGGGEKKKDDGGEKETAAAAPAAAEINKYEYFGGYGYRVEMIHPPQLFSDENPNACIVM